MPVMKIAVAGGSGFIGQPLVTRLRAAGHDVAVLTRDPSRVRAGRGVQWNPPAQGAWTTEVADADVVINLAGENVGDGRWTEARKRKLIASRLDATNAIVQALKTTPEKARTLISASATGYYGLLGDETVDENGHAGSGFLADLTVQWEKAARAAEAVARVVVVRFGVVLGGGGGALGKMLLPFKLGAGGPIGSGRQWMSWIDREDAIRIVEWAIAEPTARGVYNATAPEPVRNREFARELGKALHRPAFMPAPGFALKLVFGQMAEEVLLGGQRVTPARVLAEGFEFHYPTLGASLKSVLQ
jgi:uncharacterized protein (TIGR01777 family)